MQPTPGRHAGDHIAVLVNDVDVARITRDLAKSTDRRFTRASSSFAALWHALTFGPSNSSRVVNFATKAVNASVTEFHRCAIADQFAALIVVGIRQELFEGNFHEIWITVKGIPVGEGEFNCLSHRVDEFWTCRVHRCQVKAFQ